MTKTNRDKRKRTRQAKAYVKQVKLQHNTHKAKLLNTLVCELIPNLPDKCTVGKAID
jgi:hypothetical protein